MTKRNSGRRTGRSKKRIPEKRAAKAPGGKIAFEKPGNFLYPIPAVMVSLADENGVPNIITIAWTGTICSDPPMVSISVRKERYSYEILKRTGEFVINLTTEDLVRQADYCGVRSGRDTDKFADMDLTPEPSETVHAPAIAESPVSLECRVKEVIALGTHDMFLAEITCVRIDPAYMDSRGKFRMEDVKLAAWSHGTYYALGRKLGTFGFSVRKKKPGRKRRR